MTARATAAWLLAAALLASRASAGDPPDPAGLVAQLADAAARADAADALVRIGAPSVPALLAAVQDAGNAARGEAARVLGAIGADAVAALPVLTALVGDAASKCQTEAATALGRVAVAAAKPADAKPAPPTPTEKAVQSGLDWLARHQALDGRWACGAFDERCYGAVRCDGKGKTTHDVGVTGLAVLAFLGAGETRLKGPRAENLTTAVKWLRGVQDEDGCFGPRSTIKCNYSHACAALALAEDLRRTDTRALVEPVRRAVAFVHSARKPGAAWRYDVPPDENGDTSITTWMTRVLDAASQAGVDVDQSDLDGSLAWVESMTDPKTGRTGYQQKGGQSTRITAVMQRFPADQQETLTACGLLVRALCGRARDKDPAIAQGESLLAKKPPAWDAARGSIDFCYWMIGAEALSRLGGPTWETWRKALVEALVPKQRAGKSECARGSWDPDDPWGEDGGRVWTTCAAVLALERTSDDAARRPSMSAQVRAAAVALEKATKSADPALKKAARRALDALRAAYR